MARKLVEYADVAKAAQALKDAGKKPTIVGVRELLDSKAATPPYPPTSNAGQRKTPWSNPLPRLSCPGHHR